MYLHRIYRHMYLKTIEYIDTCTETHIPMWKRTCILINTIGTYWYCPNTSDNTVLIRLTILSLHALQYRRYILILLLYTQPLHPRLVDVFQNFENEIAPHTKRCIFDVHTPQSLHEWRAPSSCWEKGQIIYKVNFLCFLYRSWLILCSLAYKGTQLLLGKRTNYLQGKFFVFSIQKLSNLMFFGL